MSDWQAEYEKKFISAEEAAMLFMRNAENFYAPILPLYVKGPECFRTAILGRTSVG